jgi:hypothetical protein
MSYTYACMTVVWLVGVVVPAMTNYGVGLMPQQPLLQNQEFCSIIRLLLSR